MEKKDKLNLLLHQENVDLFSWKCIFYITDNQVKDCKIFSPYMQFKTKGFEFEDNKKTKKYRVVMDDQDKNIVSSINLERCLFGFDYIMVMRTLFFFMITNVTNS